MLVFTKISKYFPHVSFKFSIIILIFLFVINFILFYNLRSIGYVQNTVPILQNKQTALEEEKKDVTSEKNVEVNQCKFSNVSLAYNDRILQLKEELGEFYVKTPNSTELSKRCNQFKETMAMNSPSFASLNDENYFSNGQLIKLLKNSTILKASNAKRGSQLKLFLQLADHISAIFKPKWYPPNEIIFGSVYAGKDRHYGEVVAFYLSVILNVTKVPVAAIRKLDVKDLLLVSDRALLETFISKNNNTCLYGVCSYCSPSDLLCTDTNILEGSVIIYLSSNFKLKISRHPWSRTYKCDVLARWEIEENYCFYVRASKFYSNERNIGLFMDLIDASIFDFLIDNGDRHHYEYIEKDGTPALLFLDNGKSFGNPYLDHIDILAPLYQCCVLRNSTWNTLLHLRGGNLSYWLRFLLKEADSDVVLDEMHFKAVDRRLLIIFTVMKDCIKRKGMQNVILNY